jgi:hypothetical protein
MYHRVYALPLKPSTSAADIELLLEVLTAAPEHVPDLCTSEVFLQRSPLGVAPCELIWRSAFVNEAAHRTYGTNPYHCNVIDRYMYRESPTCLIEDTMVLAWNDEQPVNAAEAMAIRAARMPEVSPPTPATAAETPAQADEQGLHLLEQIDLKPGCRQQYLTSFRELYLPRVRTRGLKLLLVLGSPAGDTEESLTFIWAVGGWAAWNRIRSEIASDKAWLAEWLAQAEPLRTGGRRRFLTGVDLDGLDVHGAD